MTLSLETIGIYPNYQKEYYQNYIRQQEIYYQINPI